jgi:hypothetical protein
MNLSATQTATEPRATSVTAAHVGQVVSLLVAAFLLFDAVIHVLAIEPVVESFRELGFSSDAALPLGLLELALVAIYLLPRTSIIGAVALTGYLGGAVCAQFRVAAPLFSTTLFPVYVGIAVWVGLYLRNPKVRALVSA